VVVTAVDAASPDLLIVAFSASQFCVPPTGLTCGFLSVFSFVLAFLLEGAEPWLSDQFFPLLRFHRNKLLGLEAPQRQVMGYAVALRAWLALSMLCIAAW